MVTGNQALLDQIWSINKVLVHLLSLKPESSFIKDDSNYPVIFQGIRVYGNCYYPLLAIRMFTSFPCPLTRRK